VEPPLIWEESVAPEARAPREPTDHPVTPDTSGEPGCSVRFRVTAGGPLGHTQTRKEGKKYAGPATPPQRRRRAGASVRPNPGISADHPGLVISSGVFEVGPGVSPVPAGW